MKPELYVHLMELIHESERRAREHPNVVMRQIYAHHAEMLRQTLIHYEDVGEDASLEAAISKLKMDVE
jgi:hypothetical protein